MANISSTALVFKWVGKRVAHDIGLGVEIGCVVVDVSTSFGSPRLLLRPVCGTGTHWVKSKFCRIVADDWMGDGNAPEQHAPVEAAGASEIARPAPVEKKVRRRNPYRVTRNSTQRRAVGAGVEGEGTPLTASVPGPDGSANG